MPRPGEQTYFVPTPSRLTVFLRTFLLWQLVRFVWINLKMVRMISIGNHGKAPLWPLREVAPAAESDRPASGRAASATHR